MGRQRRQKILLGQPKLENRIGANNSPLARTGPGQYGGHCRVRRSAPCRFFLSWDKFSSTPKGIAVVALMPAPLKQAACHQRVIGLVDCLRGESSLTVANILAGIVVVRTMGVASREMHRGLICSEITVLTAGGGHREPRACFGGRYMGTSRFAMPR